MQRIALTAERGNIGRVWRVFVAKKGGHGFE